MVWIVDGLISAIAKVFLASGQPSHNNYPALIEPYSLVLREVMMEVLRAVVKT